jgi:drug/metabolite transporter (DMT)-like permease
MIAAYRMASPGAIAPLAYSQLLWAGLLGWCLTDHVPDVVSLLGMG